MYSPNTRAATDRDEVPSTEVGVRTRQAQAGALILAPMSMLIWPTRKHPVYRGANSRAHVNALLVKSHTSGAQGRELSRPCP